MHSSCAPPQVMFSSLGIISPSPISVVLRQIRALTEVEGSLDHWTYKHGTIEQVFSEVFSFLQGKLLCSSLVLNYNRVEFTTLHFAN